MKKIYIVFVLIFLTSSAYADKLLKSGFLSGEWDLDINFKVEKMIAKFELDAVKNIKAKHLSGGQKKRVSIAMALLSNPKIVLMDEPFQGLDLMSTNYLQETIVNLQTEDINRCCVISDHAARDLLKISDRAVVLANKKIIAQGTPKDLINNEQAKSFYFGETFNIN